MNKKQNSKQKIQKLAENDARPERAIQPTELLNDTLRRIFGCELADATQKQVYRALCISVRELLTEKNRVFGNRCTEKERKEVYYMSMEFLVGTSLRNNLFNLGLEAEFRKALADAGFDIDEIYAIDPDAGLGNGGLGRLAACFLDSAATSDLPLTGYGLRYRFGLFKQSFENDSQRENADDWTKFGDPWSHRRDKLAVKVDFANQSVIAVPYDMPVIGYENGTIGTLRLWQCEAEKELDFDAFNAQNYVKALETKNKAEDITRVLYPNDSTLEGKQLRIKQQYVLSSASLQDILRSFRENHGCDYYRLPEFDAVQLNDTHPAMAIPELIRLLQLEGMDFASAFQIAARVMPSSALTASPETKRPFSRSSSAKTVSFPIASSVTKCNRNCYLFEVDSWRLIVYD